MATMKIELNMNKKQLILQALEARIGDIRKRVIEQVKPKLINKARMIVRGAVDSYYETYSPLVYSRTESLYNVFRPEDTADGFELVFSSDRMGGHRVDGEYIYNVMFKKGYHGGAPHNGGYYWRWPSPRTLQEGGIPPYSMWYLWGPAPQSEAPWDRIQSEWNAYANGPGKQLVLNALKMEITKVIKEVS